jgi:hypothetical protein
MVNEPLPGVQVGVLLEEDAGLLQDDSAAGHAEAQGHRGRHVAGRGNPVAQLGQDILHAAAQAVGREVAVVVAGVVDGIERPARTGPGTNGATMDVGMVDDAQPFTIDSLELTFGVKATLGAGQAVAALLTAVGEATVEVKVTMSQRHLAG